MSDSQEAVSVDRYPSLRGAEVMFLILTEGPLTTEQVRRKLGYQSRHGAWRHMQMLCLSEHYLMTYFRGRWGLKEQFQKELTKKGNKVHADSV